MVSPELEARVSVRNAAPARRAGSYVLYWMVAQRRAGWNFALEHALQRATELDRPLLVFEALRCDYPWASDRLHAFVLQGMRDNRRAFAERATTYHAYVEPEPGAGRGLLEALAAHAALVVTDDWPGAFVPRMQAAAAARLACRMEAVDSCGLLPLSRSASAFPTAYAFRRFLQRELRPFLARFPRADALAEARVPRAAELPPGIEARWPGAAPEPGGLPIDHTVAPVRERGGAERAAQALAQFVRERLPRYADDRNEPALDGSSGLSAWLHFGHLSSHQTFQAVVEREGWTPANLGSGAAGRRSGWWGLGASAEAFLDQLVTWRELGLHLQRHVPDCARYETLPAWARATLERHAGDARETLYTLDELHGARTHDPLWNAAQRQLLGEGRIHNYLRMLWGKRILEWTAHPRQALEWMLALNDRLALDGRDANSVSGITWVLGRFDRPWGPERSIFGTVRYMSSANTARKLDVRPYLERWRA